MKKQQLDEKLRILVIGGHPADVFDHCGGTLAHHVKNGDSVTCLALTQGLRVHDTVISEVFRFSTEGYSQEDIERICKEREEVKYQEVRDACAIFGITDVRFLSYDDKMLQVTMPMIDATAKVIRDVRPDLIITHYPQTCGNVTNHHGNAAKIALDGAALSGVVDFDDPNPSWRVPQFAFMVNPSDCMAFDALSGHSQAVPNYFVDVTDVVDLKVRALDQMKSQQYAGQYARKSVESWNGVFGFFKGTSYCEGFVMNTSEVGSLLSVSDYLRIRANQPEIDHRTRDTRLLAYKVPYEETDNR
jgi:LmbE family N-acetylglucosaminyl deacetylase